MHPSFLQLGRLHIPVFGVFAALGLMAALTLSQRTARYACLSPETVWNAGVTAILAAFVISRLLLIAFNFRSFLQYPLLLLALPSLTTLGICFTTVFMLAYIRRRELPLLPLLDAAAPCATLLWALSSLGRYLGGTREGMPPRLSPAASGNVGGGVYQVEVYTFIAASSLCLILLGLMAVRLIQSRYNTGEITGIALISSGLAIFFIDFFRIPSTLFDRSPLEGSQIIGIAMIVVGAPLILRARTQVKRESGTETTHAV